MDNYGIISIVPALSVIVIALITKRTFEPLILGSVLGFVLCSGTGFFGAWVNGLYTVMADSTTVWLFCVCLPFGSLVALIEKSGGTIGFAEIAATKANSRKKSLLATWLLGIFLFADDYFNALAVGTAMRRLTDKFKVPRELLAYIVNCTGATVCVVIPFSTWSAFMITQMEASGAVSAGNGTSMYFQCIPYMFYALAAILVVPLVILGVIPLFGPMKKANQRAAEGQTVPDSMLKIVKDRELAKGDLAEISRPKAMNFVIPMLVLAGVTLYTADMQYGVLISLVVCLLLYIPQKLMPLGELFNTVVEGMKDMILPCAIVVAAFTLQEANEVLGLAPFVIETVEPIMNPGLLPVLTFIVVGILGFCTGCFWGAAAICFPIIVPLAQAMDVNMIITCGAIVSGAAFGSTTCFFSDAPTLTCTSTQISNADYAKNILPILIIPTVISIVGYTILGFVMA